MKLFCLSCFHQNILGRLLNTSGQVAPSGHIGQNGLLWLMRFGSCICDVALGFQGPVVEGLLVV